MPSTDTLERPPLTMVKVTCLHLICVQGPHGSRHHILVNPTPDTVKAVREWKAAEDERGITVDDRTGLHSREVPAYVLDVIVSFDTMVVTTSC